MPCNQIRTQTVEFGEKTDVKDLQKALERLGYKTELNEKTSVLSFGRYNSSEHTFSNGQLTYRGNLNLEAIKEEYANQVVVSTFTAFGWEIEQDAVGEEEWVFAKASF